MQLAWQYFKKITQGGMNRIKLYDIHIWKCHNETNCLIQSTYTNKNE